GLPSVSTFTLWDVLHEAGYSYQQTRTWCPTGTARRKRKAGVAAVTDPDAEPKKADRGRLHAGGAAGPGGVVRRPGRAVPDHPAAGPELAAGGRAGAAAARVHPQRHGQGADAVPPGRRAGASGGGD